ncbi:MAG: gamma-glutamylcyclotransferase [Pseudomonadota bacterium]
MHRLFVYGTLQPGGPNEHVLAHVNGTWQRASVVGRLAEAGWGAKLGYPALILDNGAMRVDGYLLSSDELVNEWSTLDDFEGGEYRRVVTTATLDDGEQVDAFVYTLRSVEQP